MRGRQEKPDTDLMPIFYLKSNYFRFPLIPAEILTNSQDGCIPLPNRTGKIDVPIPPVTTPEEPRVNFPQWSSVGALEGTKKRVKKESHT